MSMINSIIKYITNAQGEKPEVIRSATVKSDQSYRSHKGRKPSVIIDKDDRHQ